VIRAVLASGNAGKLREFREMLADSGIELRPQSEFAIEPAPETAPTFVENAIAKARHVARETGLPPSASTSSPESSAHPACVRHAMPANRPTTTPTTAG